MAWSGLSMFEDIIPLSTNLTKWSNTLKQFVGNCQQIAWRCLTILRDWGLKSYQTHSVKITWKSYFQWLKLIISNFRNNRPFLNSYCQKTTFSWNLQTYVGRSRFTWNKFSDLTEPLVIHQNFDPSRPNSGWSKKTNLLTLCGAFKVLQ